MNDKTATLLPDIIRDFPRVSPDVVKRASGYASSILADVAGRRGALDGRIAPLTPKTRLAGTAFTVEVRAGDNLMIHAAMQLAKPGDVLIIDGKGDTTCALMGTIMMNACVQLGITGVVIDAAVRDSEEIVEMGFPVYSVGTNPNGPTKFVPGRINHPVSVGGVTVHPGDLVIGDADGVTIIEREKAPFMLELAAKKVADEQARIATLRQGKDLKPAWVVKALQANGALKAGEAL
jgi:4-hydroxy-4-methyl-2-oxoglutarate aldolase